MVESVSFCSLFLKLFLIVLRHLAVLLLFLDLLDCIPADGLGCHLGIFALFAHSLHKLLAAFLGQFRKNKADAFAVVGGIDAEVGFLDRLFERVKYARVIRRDDKKARFRGGDVAHLINGRGDP